MHIFCTCRSFTTHYRISPACIAHIHNTNLNCIISFNPFKVIIFGPSHARARSRFINKMVKSAFECSLLNVQHNTQCCMCVCTWIQRESIFITNFYESIPCWICISKKQHSERGREMCIWRRRSVRKKKKKTALHKLLKLLFQKAIFATMHIWRNNVERKTNAPIGSCVYVYMRQPIHIHSGIPGLRPFLASSNMRKWNYDYEYSCNHCNLCV